ncbi:MAG: glycosyltransferase family 2 protein [Anaerolineales bacterium]|jgi:glycosyltransferase involved in cell wall biosynthesis|nr:glycosyl transferase [Anaerolineaceae bacterium]MDP7346395.1 glycosyltransferase family 2 protein [Anaerolineales bacterium]MDP7544646.1 glycosyltransferase family 2 protein [Anaerolineales bacterium]MDP7644225.1 glycosyltransferase family 2 protein [Anaerolineales bacterium]HJL70077.1 glycosyltransferase family 2 protein [Anaerolineales bacterium]|tara:strand:+ start:410 stop:1075 length:666 start_codon:yes stop_codon:yes gene_type:complete
MKLSVIIPVFNEAETIFELVERVRRVPLEKELVLVDDSSFDGSGEILARLGADADTTVLSHPVNRGKGVAIATALHAASGDVVVIQDADLEYDPNDFMKLIEPIEKGAAQVVYGVRDLSSQRAIMRAGNRFLTWLTGVLFGVRLHDMETCYKMMTRSVYELLSLECRRFDVEAEITAKILRAGFSIHERPIAYNARYDNKKLSPLDGLPTLRALIKYRFFS